MNRSRNNWSWLLFRKPKIPSLFFPTQINYFLVNYQEEKALINHSNRNNLNWISGLCHERTNGVQDIDSGIAGETNRSNG